MIEKSLCTGVILGFIMLLANLALPSTANTVLPRGLDYAQHHLKLTPTPPPIVCRPAEHGQVCRSAYRDAK